LIRLGFLCEMVIVCCVIFFHPGSAGDRVLTLLLPAAAAPISQPAPAWLVTAITMALWAYLLLLPFARASLSYNLHMKRKLPGALQTLLDIYANVFGMILL